MFLEELPKTEGFSDAAKFGAAAAMMVLTNIVTFFLSRRKSDSEIGKNLADAHKSEAETMKTNVSTIASLVDEIDDMILTVKGLRKEVSTLEGVTDELRDAVKTAELHEAEELNRLHRVFEADKMMLLESINKTITTVSALIDIMCSQGVAQELRMKAVKVLEMLYAVKEQL